MSWTNIPDSNYQVNRAGQVRNAITLLVLKQQPHNRGYLQVQLCYGAGVRKAYLVHRLVAQAFHANPKNKRCVDHIDGNVLNNDASNLRWATSPENQANARKTSRSNASTYKGVTPVSKARGRIVYMAMVTHNRKRIYLGTYTTEDDAARAYDLGLLGLHGAFALTNFPTDE